jgi:Na+/melibiose symporter-like transporter
VAILCPIRSIFARDSSGTGSEHPLLFLYHCYFRADTVVGLKELRLQPCSLGLLFTSVGAGSVLSAVLVLPPAREKFSANTLVVLGNLLVALVYVLMAIVRQRDLFLVVAALAGAGWRIFGL